MSFKNEGGGKGVPYFLVVDKMALFSAVEANGERVGCMNADVVCLLGVSSSCDVTARSAGEASGAQATVRSILGNS